MDKIFRSSWFIKIIAFLIALMLYNVVSSDGHSTNGDGSLLMNSGSSKQTMTEDLVIKYDSDKYVVTGQIPSTVDLLLQGSIEQITKAKFMTTREVYIDLTGKRPGTYKAKVLTDGFPSNLKIYPDPSYVTVTLQKKVKKTLPVSIDFIHKEDLEDGYKVGDAKVSPSMVTAVGAEDIVNRIAFVKGVVDLTGAKDTVKTRVALNAYDKDGNQLNVTINPAVASVEVPIISPSKDVPIYLKPMGDLPDGKAIASITIEPQMVTVFGKSDVIAGIDKIAGIELPLGNINSSQTVQLNVPVPEGAEKVEPDKISVKIDLNDNSKRTLKDVPIAVNMPADQNKKVTFVDPPNRTIDVTLVGAKSVIDKIEQSDIKLSIDVGNAQTGDSDLPIQVSGPDNVTIQLERDTVTVHIEEQ
jgi:YbbR domain-containing protein